MRFLYLLILTLSFSNVTAQSSFSILFSSPRDEGPEVIFEDASHNYIGVGQSIDSDTYIYTPKIWVIYNNGDTLTRSYPLSSDTSWVFSDIRQKDDGNYMVTGNIMWQPDYYGNLVVVELDQNFNIVSRKITMLPGMETFYQWKMKYHLGSYYIFACSAGPYSTPAWVGDPYFIKLNANFDTVYTYHTNLSGGQIICDVEFSSDGENFYIFSASYITTPLGLHDQMVVYDTSFNYKYYKDFPSNRYQGMLQANWKTDTTLLIGCNFTSHQSENKQCFSEMDTSLTVKREYFADATDTVDYCAFGTTLDFRSNDSIFYTGIKSARVAFWPQTPSWIRIGMLNGNLQPYFERFYGGDAYYRTCEIIATSDGGALIFALRYDYKTQDLEHDVLFLKVNSEGLITSNKQNFIVPSQPFSVFPNPGQDMLNINLELNNALLKISTMSGNILFTKLLSKGLHQINLQRLTAGNYVISITDNNGITFTQKWIKI